MKFYLLFLASISLTFPSTSNFALCYTSFTSSSSKPIVKLEKMVGKSKPPAAKLAIMKDISSKLKRRSHRIASMFEFSNTQGNPIEIEEAEEEVSMHREEIVFTNESKNKAVQLPLREVIPSMIFQNRKMTIFQLAKAPLGKLLHLFYFQFLR